MQLTLRLFVRVAHSSSFSRAGREFGLSQPSASRIIAQLEHDIGATLFVRTTRAVTLTEVGAEYLRRIEPLLVSLEEADHAARGSDELRGVLRIALSSSFSVREVIPRLPRFMHMHPRLRIDLLIDDRHQELVSEGVDIALRFGTLTDSTATARRLGARHRLLVASPAYLHRAGSPVVPADLVSHAIIIGPAATRPGNWTFRNATGTTAIQLEGRLNVSTNEAAVAAAAAGIGIATTALWGCRAELEKGALTAVLPDWKMDLVELHAVFPAGRATKPAARAFSAYLASCLEE